VTVKLRLIKSPPVPQEKEHRIMCKNCGRLNTYKAGAVFSERSGTVVRFEVYYFIRCEKCLQRINLPNPY
jgi:hypothetical protein